MLVGDIMRLMAKCVDWDYFNIESMTEGDGINVAGRSRIEVKNLAPLSKPSNFIEGEAAIIELHVGADLVDDVLSQSRTWMLHKSDARRRARRSGG